MADSAVQMKRKNGSLTEKLFPVTRTQDVLDTSGQSVATRLVEINTEIQKHADAINVFKEFTVNIKDFGAVYDDPTVDNMLCISLAQDYVVANGGGQIYFPDSGILYVKPFLKLKSGVKLLGAVSRPVIKIMPSVTNFYMLFGIEHVSGVTIESLTIDSNKENRSGYDISASPQIMISLSECYDVEIVRNTIKGNGVWLVSTFTGGTTQYAQRLNISLNHFIWKAGLSTAKPGLPPGVDVDNTMLYFDAVDYHVENNVFETEDGIKNMTCIEAHGARVWLTGNLIRGFRQGIIVWSLVYPPDFPLTDNDIWITKNIFEDVEAGVWVGATPGYSLTSVWVDDNSIQLNTKKYMRKSGRGIQVREPSALTDFKMSKVSISRNHIEFLPDDTGYPDPGTVFNFTGIELSEGQLELFKVLDNTIVNAPGVGIYIQNSGAVTLDLRQTIIDGNMIYNTGKNSSIAPSAYTGAYPMYIRTNASTVFTNVVFGTNYIFDDKPTGTYFTRPINTNIDYLNDPIIQTTQVKDWYKKTFDTKLYLDGQVGTMTTTQNNKYTIYGDTCIFDLKIKIPTYAITAGYQTAISLPIAANITEALLAGTFTIVNGDTVTQGVMNIPADGAKSTAYFKVPRVKFDMLAAGAEILIHIEYPIDPVAKFIPKAT